MYVNGTTGYYRGTEQCSRRAPFLILMQLEGDHKSPIRGIVRKVALRQFGHWMMGTARIKGHSITMSGAYGGDGLTVDVPLEVYAMGVPLPQGLCDAWNTGGGWNSAGSEAPAMRAWARSIMREVR